MSSARMPRIAGSATFPTALGRCGVTWGLGGIRTLHLPAQSEGRLLDQLAAAAEGAATVKGGQPDPQDHRWVSKVVARVQRHLEGDRDSFLDLPLDLQGQSPFRRAIYQQARGVAPGTTISYADLAAAAGKAGAVRAVGQAMARNRTPLLIPCHRVLRADGDLGGFSAHGGIATKLRLLSLEGAPLDAIAKAGTVRLGRADPQLGTIIRRVGPYRLPRQQRGDPFMALVETIVHQQLSMKAGATIFRRMRAALEKQQPLDAALLLRTPSSTLRQLGLSQQKASYIKDLCQRSAAGQIPWRRLARMDDERVIEALVQIKGIGRWSAEMFLMFRLGRLNVLPLGDLGLKKGVQLTYGLKSLPSEDQLKSIAAQWSPFSTIATWYLWRALEGGGLI